MQKVWKWIKSKNKDLKNGDEDRFPNKRKWHSYIFPGRGDRQPTRSITENFDQVASNSMPTIVPNKQRSNSAKNEQKRRRSQRLPSQKHQNAPTTTPFETMTVSLNIEMSPQSSFKSKDFILVDRKNSRANQQVFSATEAHALAIQAIQAVEPSGSAGVIITDIAGPEEENQSGRSSHTYFSTATSPVDQNQIITDSPTGKRVSIQSPKVSVVGSPPLKMDTLSPPSSKAEVRKLWRLSIQSSVDLSSSDDENFDADDEITTTCIGDMTSIPIQKSENVNFSPPTKKGFFGKKTFSELSLKNASAKSAGVFASLPRAFKNKHSLTRRGSDNSLGRDCAQTSLSLGPTEALAVPTSLRASRKLRFIIPQLFDFSVSISTVDFNGETNLAEHGTRHGNNSSTTCSSNKFAPETEPRTKGTATMISAAVMFVDCENADNAGAGATKNGPNKTAGSKSSLNLLYAPGMISPGNSKESDDSHSRLSELDRRQLTLAQRRQSNLELVHQASGRRASTTLIPLTSAQIHLVRSLWRQVYLSKGPTVIGQTIQHRLFFKVQSLREQFRRTPLPKNSINHDSFSKAHCKQMAEMIDKIVENLDDLESVGPELERIGRVHAHVSNGQLSSKVWNAVAETFIDCTLEWGDRRARSETVRKAWALIVAFIIERIKHGHLDERRQIAAMNSTISSLKRVGVASLTPSGGNGATICPARISKTFSGDTYHHRKVGSLDAVTDKTRASKKKSEVGAPNKKASIKLSLTRSKSPTHYTMV